MERSRVVKRFRELGWDPVLPDPEDDRNARELKTQNLRQALQTRQNLVDQALAGGLPPSTDLASSKPPLLPIKRPPRMQKLSTDKDTSFQTPPTQKISAPGLALGNKPQAQLNNTHEDTSGGGTGGSTLVVTTGPKAAALTAQGLIVSADAKKNPTTDPLSRLLQGNNKGKTNINTSCGGSGADGNDVNNGSNLPPVDLAGWRRTVNASQDRNAKPSSRPKPPQQQQQQQTRLQVAVPPLRRSQRTRPTSRLVNVSGASATLLPHRDHHTDPATARGDAVVYKQPNIISNNNHGKNTTASGVITNAAANNVTSADDMAIDPIVASPTQSPPIKLTIPRVIDNSPKKKIKNNKNMVGPIVQFNTNINNNNTKKRKLDVHKVGGVVATAIEEDLEIEKGEEEKMEEEAALVAAEEKDDDEGHAGAVPPTRPTPLGERTHAPRGPRSRRPINPLPLPPLAINESVPATPAGLFNISETPERTRGGGGANTRSAFKKRDIKQISGTELAHDASNKLLPGVFSPLTDLNIHPQVEAAAEAEAAAMPNETKGTVGGAEEEPGQQLEPAKGQKQQQVEENKISSLNHNNNNNNRLAAILEETEATPAAYNHRLFASTAAGAASVTTTGGANNRRTGRQLRPTSARLASLLAAEMVPETALDDIDIYALDEAAGAAAGGGGGNGVGDAEESEDPGIGGGLGGAVGYMVMTTTAKKMPVAATVPPHTALPTLRPFSPYSFSLPRSTDRRFRPDSFGRLGGGGFGGNITPLPLLRMMQQQQQQQQQGPHSVHLDGFRPASTTLKPCNGAGSNSRSAFDATYLSLSTAEEPLSMNLRLPQPALAVVTSADGRYMAVLLGSHAAGLEPCEVLVFAVSLQRAADIDKITKSSQAEASAMELEAAAHNINKKIDVNPPPPPSELTAPPSPSPAAARVVASILVQRSHHASRLPITPSCLALALTPKGDLILILSGVFDLPDGPASLGRPTIHAIHCGTGSSNTGIGLPTTHNAVGTALGVESDDPFFSIALLGPHTLLAVGDGSSGASVIEFDPQWKSYSWGRTLPPAITYNTTSTDNLDNPAHNTGASSGVGCDGGSGGAVGLDDVCSLLITPVPPSTISVQDATADPATADLLAKNKNTNKKDSSFSSQKYMLTGISGNGMVGSWEMSATTASSIATASHAEYAVRAAIPIPHISFGKHNTNKEKKNSGGEENNDEGRKSTQTTRVQCFVALLQNRFSDIGETSVAVATLSPSGGLVLGTPVPVPAAVTAIGSLTPPSLSSSKGLFVSPPNDIASAKIADQKDTKAPRAQEETNADAGGDITSSNNINSKSSFFHHNQDKILLGCGNGTLRVWNIRTGVCSPPLDVCCGAAITSFASTTMAGGSDGVSGEGIGIEAVICTSVAGDCVILETAALLELV